MPATGRQWTEPQWRGITTVGKSLLVSAAAGSGKTAMLSERCAYLVCDAPEPYRCDVDELLVVTFTDAAAAEMRSRITSALRARSATDASDRLKKQLALIDQASVSTLHSFCSRLLRQHFHLVGLDPAFVVMDGEEAKLLRLEVAREIVHDRYDSPELAADFLRLVDAYAEGDDERLVRQVIRAHEMLSSLVDPQAWLDRTRQRLAEAAEAPLVASELGGELIDLLGLRVKALRERCAGSIDLVSKLGNFPKYLAQLHDYAAMLRHWELVLETDGPDALAEEVNAAADALPRLPPVPADTPHKSVAKAAIDAVREGIKGGAWRESLRFTAEQWRDGMRRVLPHAQAFLSLVEQFATRYTKAKDAARQLDFNDLERFALRVLRDPRKPGLHPTPTARSYHRLFKHVLVDEYQDINELQDAILALLSHECVVAEGASDGATERQSDGGEGQRTGGKTGAGTVPVSASAGAKAVRVPVSDSLASDPSSLFPSSLRRSVAPSLSTSSFPNLFCVGDVKQSIYRFRLAEPLRFLQREASFRHPALNGPTHGQVIDLQANFRSRGPLLEAINGVFERLMTQEAAEILYDASHRLVPGKTYPVVDNAAAGSCFAGSPIELHLLPKTLVGGEDDAGSVDDGPGDELDRAEREAVLLAQRIRQIVGADGSTPWCVMDDDMKPRPARYRDVVILLRSMRYKADQYADVLRRAGVPVHSESGTGYFESMEVRDVLALLSVLDNQRQDVPLAAVLRSPIASLPEPEDSLARIRLAYASRERPVPFHQAVVRYAAEQDDELAAKLRDFLRELDGWRHMAHRRPLAETVWAIFEQSGYLAFVSGLTGGRQRVANLMHLHERARQFGSFQRQGLSRFMQFLENLREESDLGLPSVASEAEDVVRIMSVHRSKGLEFPIVVLPDLGKSINLSDCAGSIVLDREGGLGMSVVDEVKQVRYPSLALTLVQERLRRLSMAEELRVLYVAMTRAKEHLILLGTCGEDSPEKWRGRWSDHRGPLPADAVQGAGCLLDWLGAVSACAPGAAGEIIQVVPHGSAEVAAWEPPGKSRDAENPELFKLARLEPLDPPPPPYPAAEEVIARMTFAYPHRALAAQPAVRSVTSAATANVTPGPRRDWSAALAKPKFLATGAAPSAVDVGAATHLVLQHLDFTRPIDDPADVDAQVRSMVERRMLDATQAKSVDVAAITWLAGTDVGQLLRASGSRLLREMPVYYAAPPDVAAEGEPIDPLDQVMVRGRLDVLIPSDSGATIVDFKTDAVAPDQVSARGESYAAQMRQYRAAIERITGKPVARACLVFLAARAMYDVE